MSSPHGSLTSPSGLPASHGLLTDMLSPLYPLPSLGGHVAVDRLYTPEVLNFPLMIQNWLRHFFVVVAHIFAVLPTTDAVILFLHSTIQFSQSALSRVSCCTFIASSGVTSPSFH